MQKKDQVPHTDDSQCITSHEDRKKAREALRQEALAAYEHYVQTGLHLTHDEVMDWMDKIIQGEDAPMPKCHT